MARQLRRALALECPTPRWSQVNHQRRRMLSHNTGAAANDAHSRQPSGSSKKGVTLAKRFYEKAFVRPAAATNASDQQNGWYEIALDHRVLKTPAKKPLRLTSPALAQAIAAEWEWQDSSGLRAITMPLMKLAAIAIDQIPKDKERIITSLVKFCHTDALCCRASPGSVLYEKQAMHWDPLLDWVETEIGARPVISSSIFGPTQPKDFVNSLEKSLRSLNDWQLAAFDSLAGSARSVVVALAIARQRLSIEEAIAIIRLEENHQVEEWGYVEGGHDIDEADIRVQISGPSVFLRLLSLGSQEKPL